MVVIYIFLFLINCARATPQDEERAILIQLYDSTNGQYWLRSNNWLLNNISACDWAGISCIDGFVVRLDLQSNQLTGTLPESIGNLLMLDTINLEGNHLSGTLPESIKKLTRLERLWLGGNQFIGTIPTWINNLTNLYYLYLTANQFTGTIPDFSSLPRLQHLYLNNNQLEGTIPATLAANTYLDTIFLVGNKLTGSIPAELGQLTRLQHVQLGRNELSGTIPESIYQITSLGLFSIAHNKISGTISNKISQLQNLLGFDFGYNQISGTIPESIGELKALVRFEAFANNLTGTIPKSVTQLTRLTQLLVSDNQLTGTIPDNIGNMVNLTHFYLSRNKLSGTLPNSITNLRNLIWLQISNNELTGTIPNNLGQLTLLQQLHLNTNKFSGTIPASIGQLSMLQRFEGYSNLLEGPIPDTIGNLKRLMAVNLVYNNLTGTLPQSMGGMSSLLTFAVSHNRISGVIPESFGTFQSMNGLFLNNNNLIGTIPRALGRNRMLSHLMLGGNRLTGPLPQFESNDLPARLQYFTANDNQLTGSVPLAYALLNNLRHVNFANNQLTGSVLHLFDLTDTISEIFLSNNKFVGTIPPGLTTRVLLKSLFIDNNQFSGTIPESFGRLISLEQVQFDKNAFTGTLPATLSRLFRLQELHVANNDLTGTIPIELFELPLAELDLSNNNLNGTIAHAITSMQLLRKIDISSNWFTGTLPAMNNMRTLQQIHLHDNLFRGCLSLPSSFKSESSKCSLDGNSFCCSTEEFNCYDAVCPAKSTLYVYSGSTLSLSNIHNLAAFHNLIVEPNAKLVVRNKDALVVDCMQFEGEIVFDMTESEAETPVFYITTTCGGSDIDSMTKISSVGRGCYSSSIRSVAKTLTFTLSCPKEKTSLALVVGISVPLGILFIAAMVLFIVTMNARRKREEQLKSRVEMLTLSSSHVKNHSAPPEEFKFKLPDDLPIKISKTSFKFGTRGDLLIVDRPVRDSFTVSLRKSKAISVGSLYDKLVQHRTVVQIRPITSSKYDLVATPQVFEVPEGGSTDVELVLTMKMTTKCQVSFWIELPEEEVYSLIEFDAASEHSPWIDVDEVQVEGDAIGEGGFGAVYKAMYRGQRVAFKTLKMQDLGDEVTHEFEQEVRMMMNLHHKSIVQFIGASRVSGKRAILTEFITNGDLKHLLQKQQLDMKFKLKLALDIAEALKFLHLNNILHRDIKPENALVVSTSKDAIVNVKLADFGTARSVSDSVTSKFTKGVGTPIYMAVEILKNESYARNADIYSFGVLLWAIMTQDEPYKEFKYSWDVAEFVLQGKRLPVPQDCPHQIGQLISRCWAQDPNDRPLIGDVVKTIETVYLSTK